MHSVYVTNHQHLLNGQDNHVSLFPPPMRPCCTCTPPVARCRAIIHIVSGASPDPVGDFRAINQELALFSEALAVKPQVGSACGSDCALVSMYFVFGDRQVSSPMNSVIYCASQRRGLSQILHG